MSYNKIYNYDEMNHHSNNILQVTQTITQNL